MTSDSISPETPESGAVEGLCRGAAAGGLDDLARLLALYHDRLLERVVRKVGPDWRGKIDPEDVLQESYVDIFAGIETFRYQGLDSFYHWAGQIVDRRYVDQVRRQRAAKRDITREKTAAAGGGHRSTYQGLLEQCVRDSRTPSRFVSAAETVSAVMSGIARLPDDYRTVLRRIYLDGEPAGRVAADMQRSEDAVRRLASRALDRLREMLV